MFWLLFRVACVPERQPEHHNGREVSGGVGVAGGLDPADRHPVDVRIQLRHKPPELLCRPDSLASESGRAPAYDFTSSLAMWTESAWLPPLPHRYRCPPASSTDAQPALVIHLHATDLPGAEWTVDTVARTVRREHAKGDVAIGGPAWSLARWCWGRPVGAEIEAFGDLETAEQWRRTIAP